MKSNNEIQTTRLKYTKTQNRKTWVDFNYHSPFVTKLPTHLKTPTLISHRCLLIQYVVEKQTQTKNKKIASRIYRIKFRTCKNMWARNN